jgi:glycosyltransferase involved in cell wall biosynthesis
MKRKAKKMNLNKNFVFAGRIDDRELIAKIYSRANLNLMISMFDTASLSINESASQYTPSICIKNSIVGGGITDNVNGYLSGNSAKQIADKVLDMIKNKKAYNNVCENAHQQLYTT